MTYTHRDHTAIKLRLDPRHRRISGSTTHGRLDFDAPYISHIEGNLWMGGCTNGLVLPKHIKHHVSLYPWENYTVRHHLDSSMAVKMYDDHSGVNVDHVLAIANWVNQCVAQSDTLVNCQAGLNRSGLIAATSLVLRGWDPGDAISWLRERRSHAVLCNKTFERFIHALPALQQVAP